MRQKGWRLKRLRNFIPVSILGILYMFSKVPTSLWLLVNVRTFIHYLYTRRVQPFIYGNKSSAQCTWLEIYSDDPSGNYTVWTFITLIYLNLALMSDYTQSYIKYLLSLLSLSIYCELCKPSDLVGLVQMDLTLC